MSAPSIRAIIAAISTVIAIPISITFFGSTPVACETWDHGVQPEFKRSSQHLLWDRMDLRPPSNPHPRTAARQALLRTLAVPMRASRPGQVGLTRRETPAHSGVRLRCLRSIAGGG